MYLERVVKVIFGDVSVIRRRIKNFLKYLLEKLKPLNKFLSEIIMFIYLIFLAAFVVMKQIGNNYNIIVIIGILFPKSLYN